MSVAKEEIENAIIDAMLAESALDDLLAVYRGMPLMVPQQFYPFAEVLIEQERTARTLTGNVHERVYEGVITFNVRVQDAPQVVARKATVASYVTVQNLVDAAVELFKRTANRDLGGLTFTNGAVTMFQVGGQAVEYGIALRNQYGNAIGRDNNFDNTGMLPFVCVTQETAT